LPQGVSSYALLQKCRCQKSARQLLFEEYMISIAEGGLLRSRQPLLLWFLFFEFFDDVFKGF